MYFISNLKHTINTKVLHVIDDVCLRTQATFYIKKPVTMT